jgi:hypothetical protein
MSDKKRGAGDLFLLALIVIAVLIGLSKVNGH